MLQDVESLTNSEMGSIAILHNLNHLKSATNLTDVYKMACNRCVRLAWLLGLGWGIVLSTASLLLSIMSYNVSRFLGINFMDAYDGYQ